MTESQITLHVANMKCAGCVTSVEQAILNTTGVETTEVSLETGTATVTGNVDVHTLVQNITDAGYPADPA